MEMSRPAHPRMAATEMRRLMLEKFAELRVASCRKCLFLLPYWGPAAGSSTGYWYLSIPAHCPASCYSGLTIFWAQLTTNYTIEAPEPEIPVFKFGTRVGKQ
jgi:hypothetical protein